MAPDDIERPSWHAAVEHAQFEFYEPDTDGERWAGGFSANGSLIGIRGTIDGHTAMVETSGAQRAVPRLLERRASISELLWHHVRSDDTDVTLPYSPTIKADIRTATIGSDSHTVPGIRRR